MKALVLLGALAACEPGWTVHTTLRDPMNRRVSDATVGSIGAFPKGCDVYIAKSGYRTQHFAYSALCPDGGDCARPYLFDLVLEEEAP